MPDRRHKQVVNIDEVTPRDEARGGFTFRGRRLGPEVGSRSLGCTHFELAPGMTAFPFHFHTNYEEALYVLEGAGTLRIGDAEVNLRAGDYVAFPAGPESAHALTNTGTISLHYLALSGPATPVSLDICVYPDSNKVAYAAGVDPAKGWRGGAWIMGLHKQQPMVDYYLDEPIAKRDG